jgi:hypothetical protein
MKFDYSAWRTNELKNPPVTNGRNGGPAEARPPAPHSWPGRSRLGWRDTLVTSGELFRMNRIFVVFLLFLAPAFGQKPAAAIFSQIHEISATLSQITGWQVKQEVPSQILTKEAFRRYMEAHTSGRSAQKDIHSAELALKMFGLVPQDFNLAKETVDLLGEQAAAFYDYKKKRLFILDSTQEGDDQRMALVHELAHALADQQHPLGKYLDNGMPTDDEATAREAVMEGQAQWLTWAYESKRTGGPAELPVNMLERLTREEDENPDFPVLGAAPLYIRESLLFPYNAGTRFQDAVFRKMGKQSFEEVFAHGPRSTQQIIHPDRYFSGNGPAALEAPSIMMTAGADARNLKLLVDGSVGEFDHEVLVRQYVGKEESEDIAPHWRAGAFRLYEHKKDKHAVLAYASQWDTPEAAQNYFGLYLQVLQRKWKQMKMTSRSATEATGTGDSGKFVLRITGSVVESIEGLR